MDVVIELLGGRWVGIEVKLDVVFVALGCDGELLVGGDAALVGFEEMFGGLRRCSSGRVSGSPLTVAESCSSVRVSICRRCCVCDR